MREVGNCPAVAHEVCASLAGPNPGGLSAREPQLACSASQSVENRPLWAKGSSSLSHTRERRRKCSGNQLHLTESPRPPAFHMAGAEKSAVAEHGHKNIVPSRVETTQQGRQEGRNRNETSAMHQCHHVMSSFGGRW